MTIASDSKVTGHLSMLDISDLGSAQPAKLINQKTVGFYEIKYC